VILHVEFGKEGIWTHNSQTTLLSHPFPGLVSLIDRARTLRDHRGGILTLQDLMASAEVWVYHWQTRCGARGLASCIL
jgi:hypothetical protein